MNEQPLSPSDTTDRTADLVTVVLDALGAVAPDLDDVQVDVSADLQDDLGLDSMDSLNLVAALKERTGLEIPDRELSRLRTVSAVADWLEEHLASS